MRTTVEQPPTFELAVDLKTAKQIEVSDDRTIQNPKSKIQNGWDSTTSAGAGGQGD